MAKVDGFITGWMSHRNALLELLETLEDKHVHFRPWEGAMSLSELVLHITGSTSMFVHIVKGNQPPSPESQEITSIQELKEAAQAITNATKALLESTEDEQLEKNVAFNGMEMPGFAMLEMAKEHEIHHKGQLFTYARLIGIEKLPFFISR